MPVCSHLPPANVYTKKIQFKLSNGHNVMLVPADTENIMFLMVSSGFMIPRWICMSFEVKTIDNYSSL